MSDGLLSSNKTEDLLNKHLLHQIKAPINQQTKSSLPDPGLLYYRKEIFFVYGENIFRKGIIMRLADFFGFQEAQSSIYLLWLVDIIW